MKQILRNKLVSKLENLYAIKIKENSSPYTKVCVEKISFDESDYIDYEIDEDEFIQLLETFISEMQGLEIDIELKLYNEKFIYRKFIIKKNADFDLEEYEYDLARIADSIEFPEEIDSYEIGTQAVIRLAFIFYNNDGIHFRDNEHIKELHFYNHIKLDIASMF
jgi:hypothetical protein